MSEAQAPVDLGEVIMTPVAGPIEQPPTSDLTTAPSKKRGRPSKAELAAREASETVSEGRGTTDAEKAPVAADLVSAAIESTPPADLDEPVLGIYQLGVDVKVPESMTFFSAGADVRAYFTGIDDVEIFTGANKQAGGAIRENFGVRSIVLQPGARAKIPTGLIFDIPSGWKIAVHPRSGQSLKQGLNLANCVAVIDYDYTDQLYILLANTSQLRVEIAHDDRIAQMSLEKVWPYRVKILSAPPQPKSDRTGGVGSTGVK